MKKLESVVKELTTEIGDLGIGFDFNVFSGQQGLIDIGRTHAVQSAGQTPDFSEFNDLAQLNLRTGPPAALVFSFQAIGPRFRGLVGVVSYLITQGTGPALIEGGTFQINYEEDLASATARFSPWLDRVIVNGLNMWRLTL